MEPLIVKDDGRDRGYPGGLSLGDVDADGDLDLLATRGYDPTAKTYKGDRSLLYLNDGQGAFVRQESPWSDEEAPDSGATLADVDAVALHLAATWHNLAGEQTDQESRSGGVGPRVDSSCWTE